MTTIAEYANHAGGSLMPSTTTCADLDCEQTPSARLRYEAPDRTQYEYLLCQPHTDRAHDWLADRPQLAATAVSEHLAGRVDQPVLF